jgi:hypothetical protein
VQALAAGRKTHPDLMAEAIDIHATQGLEGQRLGAVAQMGERCNRTAEVRGSIPLSSTKALLSRLNRISAETGLGGDHRDFCRNGSRDLPRIDLGDMPMFRTRGAFRKITHE